MGRSKRVPRGEPANWKPDEENELLAWLDYNLEKSSDGFATFKQSVSEHLRRVCNVSYTYEQCRRKLHSLWQHYGDESAIKVAVLHEHGSETLTLLETAQKDSILARVIALRERDLNFPRRLRSVSRNSATPSQQQGYNRQTTSATVQRPQLHVPSVVISPNRVRKAKRPRRQRRKRRLLSRQVLIRQTRRRLRLTLLNCEKGFSQSFEPGRTRRWRGQKQQRNRPRRYGYNRQHGHDHGPRT
jgi:hypothetical protein